MVSPILSWFPKFYKQTDLRGVCVRPVIMENVGILQLMLATLDVQNFWFHNKRTSDGARLLLFISVG
jgi:hypothetical protein